MALTQRIPSGWELEFEVTYYDGVMERDYTRLEYRHAASGNAVRITDVQEPNSFEGWRYLVRVTGPDHVTLGTVEELEEAKDLALEFMEGYGNGS